jgi:hypothetical protein
LVRHRRQRRVGPPLRDPWVFTRFTRYCPDYLRGDGSLIQRRHGGAWSKYWRLPVVFACPTHQRLLAHTCPTCNALALARPANLARPLPMAGHQVTHPTACRNPDPAQPAAPCGYRLGSSIGVGDGIRRPEPDQRLLRLQAQLLCRSMATSLRRRSSGSRPPHLGTSWTCGSSLGCCIPVGLPRGT